MKTKLAVCCFSLGVLVSEAKGKGKSKRSSDVTDSSPSDTDMYMETSFTTGQDENFDSTVINAYADVGFGYVGAADFLSQSDDYEPFLQSHEPILNDYGFPSDPESTDGYDEVDAGIRVTPEGNVFEKVGIGSATTWEESSSGGGDTAMNTEEDITEMEVVYQSIIGRDNRGLVADTSVDPYKYIGDLDYTGYALGGCTGTIIGPNHVLTAAHCVYNRETRKFLPLKQFTPGRYRSWGARAQYWNTGVWEIQDVTFSSRYSKYNDLAYDIAVIRTKEHETHGAIGEKVGYLEVTSPKCYARIDSGAMIAGYPSDKTSGEMWESGACGGWSYNCGKKRVFHQCDTYGGQSGAAMLDGSNRVFGIHTHGGYSWNSGVAITKEHMELLADWMS